MSADPPDADFESPSNERHARTYWATVAGLILLLWTVPGIPTQDGPSHLYNLALMNDLLGGDSSRATDHRLVFDTPTNLGFVALGLPLAKILPLWAVERAVLSLHVLLLAFFATTWLAQCSRKVYPTAWIALAFSLPWSLFMGFYGYQLGADLALLAVCGAWKLRDRALYTTVLWAWGLGTLVLFFHPIAFGLLAGLLALVQLMNPGESIKGRLLRAAVVTVPLLAMLLFLLTGDTGDTRLEWRSADYVLLTLATFGTFTFSTQLSTCLLVSLGWFLLCLPGDELRSWDPLTRFAFVGGVSLAALHLFLPDFDVGEWSRESPR